MPSRPRALLDANVLFSNHQRNLLLQIASRELFDAVWTATIEEEWLRNTDERTRERIAGYTIPLIRSHFPNAVVGGFDPDRVVGQTDANDRHVASAAITVPPSSLDHAAPFAFSRISRGNVFDC